VLVEHIGDYVVAPDALQLYLTLYLSCLNRIPAMAVYIRPLFGSFFYGGVSPSKIGLSAPSLERTQLLSTARVFLYT
jgi:hypothetical protein